MRNVYSAIISRYPHQKFSNLINIMIFQVVAVAGFTPVEEVERISMGPRDMVGRVVRDLLQGGVGGRSEYFNIYGGFGGGGGAGGWGGGGGEGGGYSGGGSGYSVLSACGGGGGSYNVGNNRQNECCHNKAGHGQVTIILL